jgi:hypothetical protein
MLNQRDGSINADFDCVPASIAAGIQFLTGKRFAAWQLKDATPAYGPAYTGATAASEYVDFCTRQGVRLYARDASSYADAINIACQEIAKGHPVIFTQQDDYAPPLERGNWTHVCVWYADNGASMTAMDPFGGFALTYSKAVWTARLRSSQVWIMERASMIPNGWKDDGKVITAPNGVTIRDGFAAYIRAHGWDANNVPLAQEEGANPVEEGFPQNPSGGTRQVFAYCELCWTSARGVYIATVGRELSVVRADRDKYKQLAQQQTAKIDDLNAQIAQLKAQQNSGDGAQLAALQAKLDAAKSALASIQTSAQQAVAAA